MVNFYCDKENQINGKIAEKKANVVQVQCGEKYLGQMFRRVLITRVMEEDSKWQE